MAALRSNIRVVVAGDRCTGKSSLIAAAASDAFPENVPPVLPPTSLPADFYPDAVPLTLIDTSSSPESRAKLNEEFKRADVIVLTYACDQTMTLTRLSTYWLLELRRLEIKVPVILVGCKLDLRDENQQMSMEQVMAPIMQRFREIETCIECSAATQIQTPEVFYYAQKAVLHPTAPLFDQERQSMKPRCINALRRIFVFCDNDMDGTLNDGELNEFQVKCFHAPLQPAEIVGVKRVVLEKLPSGVNERGLTLQGFLFLHALFIEKGRLETTWAVLRKFGYDDNLNLRDDFLPVPCKQAPDQSVELTSEAVEFLRGVFRLFDKDNDGGLHPVELDELFSVLLQRVRGVRLLIRMLQKEQLSEIYLSMDFSQRYFLYKGDSILFGPRMLCPCIHWFLMTILDPPHSLANLIYIGYGGNPALALRVTQRRSIDRKKQRSENVFQCFVFGPKNAGKSALLNSLLARPFSKNYTSTTVENYAANIIDNVGGSKRTLVMREIPEDGVKKLLSNKEFLAACDVAIFVYDSGGSVVQEYFGFYEYATIRFPISSSDENSWNRSRELLVEVARQGEQSSYVVPCLLIAAKDDLDPCPLAVRNSVRVCQGLGVEAPIPVSMKLGNSKSVFSRIIGAAEHPHLSIPETEIRRNRKQYQKLVNHSLLFVSVGAAVGLAGLAAYRMYAARTNTSS